MFTIVLKQAIPCYLDQTHCFGGYNCHEVIISNSHVSETIFKLIHVVMSVVLVVLKSCLTHGIGEFKT